MDNYVAFDLETTSLSPESGEIIEIGAWKVKEGVVISKYSSLVRPRGYIPRDIQSLTGISNEMLVGELTIEDVIPEFFKYCEDLPLLGHNLPFDYKFLCTKSKPLGYDFSLNCTRCGIDTLKLCNSYLKDCPSKKLEDVAKYFKIHVTGSDSHFHRAEYDAYVTKLIYGRFKCFYPNLAGVQTPIILDKRDVTTYGKVVCNDTLSFE